MRFRTFLGGIALATSLSWFLGVSVSKHIEGNKHICNYCGDEDPSTPWIAHESDCPDGPNGIPDSLLIDGMPECEAR